MVQLFVLFEHASGYALFRMSQYEEIGSFLPEVRKSVKDLGKFRSIARLMAYQKFDSRKEALDNLSSISKGEAHRDLLLFLESNVPKAKKSNQAIVLGVQDSHLAMAISSTLSIDCQTSEVITEISRGIRFHFHKFVKGFADSQMVIKAQLGLSHHYSRSKLNLTVNKFDNIIIQNTSMLDQLEKDINTLAGQVIRWYSTHFPELIKIVPDIPLFIKCVTAIKNRKDINNDTEIKLQAILSDENKVQSIIEAAMKSMGMDIADEDILNIVDFVEQVVSLIQRRDEINVYLNSKMQKIAPSLSTLVGEKVGAQLISQAGGLLNLAKLPASTVQILGAEKALFRKLKKKKSALKFRNVGLLSSIGKANKSPSGQMSRFLAFKCSLASRSDCFSKTPSDAFGKELKQSVDDRRKFFETGKFASQDEVQKKLQIKASRKALKRKRCKESNKKKLACEKTVSVNETSKIVESAKLKDSKENGKIQRTSKRNASKLSDNEHNIENDGSIKKMLSSSKKKRKSERLLN